MSRLVELGWSDGNRWKNVTDGLPKARGSTIMIFTSNVKTPGEFYAVNNHGLFLSTDSGSTWKKLDTLWPKEYLKHTPWSLAINKDSYLASPAAVILLDNSKMVFRKIGRSMKRLARQIVGRLPVESSSYSTSVHRSGGVHNKL